MSDRLSDLTHRMDIDQRARGFVELTRAKALARGGRGDLLTILEGRPGARPVVEYLRKAAVGHVAVDPASALRESLRVGAPFMDVIRPATLLGQLRGFVPAPPRVGIPLGVEPPTAGWVTEGQPIPATSLNLDHLAFLDFHKLGSLLAVPKETVRSTEDAAISLLERLLRQAVIRAENTALLSTDARVAGNNPAGLLFGLSPIGGGSPESLQDLTDLWASVRDGEPIAPYFITSGRGAMYLASLRGDSGPAFPDVSAIGGGRIAGVPQLVAREAANRLILVDAAALGVMDAGVLVDSGEHAAIMQDDSPTSPAQLVSAFQSNSEFLRIIRVLDWQLGHDDAVGFIELPIGGSPA